MKYLILFCLLTLGVSAQAQKTEVLITIEVPTDKMVEFRDLFCIEYNRQDSIISGGVKVVNPETKNQFVRRMTGEFVLEWYKNIYQARKAREELKKVDTSIDITVKN